MKIRYVGESFGVDSLTDGKIYECLGIDTVKKQADDDELFLNSDQVEFSLLRVIDDSEEDYLYSPINPAPWDGSSPGGRWEIVEDDEKGTLAKVIK